MGTPSTELAERFFVADTKDPKSGPRYPADFLRSVENRNFHNPATGNNVKFVSLGPAEQSKIYHQWRATHRRTPAQQLAPGIAKTMAPVDQNAMTHVVTRGSVDVAETADHLGESKEDAQARLDRLEQGGYLVGNETEEGHPYWVPSELGYEIARHLRSQQPRKTSNMERIEDWTFIATGDPHRRKFRHPKTHNWVVFDSLPQEEQMRFKQQWQLQQSQPEAQHAVVEGGPGDLGDAGGDAGMGGGEGAMAMENAMFERGVTNTGDVEFGEPMAMAELEARLGDYLGMPIEDMLAPGGLGIVPVSLGTVDDPDSRHEGPDTDMEGEHMGMEESPDMGSWSFLAEEDKDAMDRTMWAPVLTPSVNGLGKGEPPPEPPPPAQVRRQLQERMRDLGRSLMIAGAKSPRMQMMEIQTALTGLMDQLELLADQPGREALRRRILLQLRPRVMRF